MFTNMCKALVAEKGDGMTLLPEQPEQMFIVLEGADWNDALGMAVLHRRTHPDKPIEITHKDGLWTVVRCVYRE